MRCLSMPTGKGLHSFGSCKLVAQGRCQPQRRSNAWLSVQVPLSQLLHPPRRAVSLSSSQIRAECSTAAALTASRPGLAAPAHRHTLSTCPESVYIHLPFCKRKCFYCDFPVEAVGRLTTGNTVQQRMGDYIAVLCQEMKSTKTLGNLPLKTIYFGGGTPSLVPPHLIDKILKTLSSSYGIHSQAEISMEADPGTFDLPKLQAYASLGVNRLSIGVQSFQQDLLTACGRAHNLEEVYRAIEAVQSSGIPSWSLDLISGLPGLTLDMWQESLNKAVAAKPSHISVYDLQVEPGTPFSRWYTPEVSPLPGDLQAAAMYASAVLTLRRAGYEHYEVSNYALPGHRSRHNQAYWDSSSYYAFGLGAASYLEGRRFSRPKGMAAYKQWVGTLVESSQKEGPGIPGGEELPETQEDQMLDSIMLRLRTSEGLDMQAFTAKYGPQAGLGVLKGLQTHFKSGHALLQLAPIASDNKTAEKLEIKTIQAEVGRGDVSVNVKASLQQQGKTADLFEVLQTGFGSSSSLRHGQQGDGPAMAAMAAGGLAAQGVWSQASLKEKDGGGGIEIVGSGGSGEHVELPSSKEEGIASQIVERVRLSDPHGFLVSNTIISDVFAALSNMEEGHT